MGGSIGQIVRILQKRADKAELLNTELENAIFELAQCPFPLHDYVSKKTWELACKIVAERRAANS